MMASLAAAGCGVSPHPARQCRQAFECRAGQVPRAGARAIVHIQLVVLRRRQQRRMTSHYFIIPGRNGANAVGGVVVAEGEVCGATTGLQGWSSRLA